MIVWCLFGFLAAFGLGCILMVLWGSFLYAGASGMVLCLGSSRERMILALALSRMVGVGLLRCNVFTDCEGLTEAEREVLREKGVVLIQQRNGAREFDGTGNGDSSGHDCCRDLPEL